MAEECGRRTAGGFGLGGGGGGLCGDGVEGLEGLVLSGGLLGVEAGVVDGVEVFGGLAEGVGLGDGREMVEGERVLVADVDDRPGWVDHVCEELWGEVFGEIGLEVWLEVWLVVCVMGGVVVGGVCVVFHGPKVRWPRRNATGNRRMTTKLRTNRVGRAK